MFRMDIRTLEKKYKVLLHLLNFNLRHHYLFLKSIHDESDMHDDYRKNALQKING